jgi:hypothetical protein
MKENIIDTAFVTGEHQKQSNTIISNRSSGQIESFVAVSTATGLTKQVAEQRHTKSGTALSVFRYR